MHKPTTMMILILHALKLMSTLESILLDTFIKPYDFLFYSIYEKKKDGMEIILKEGRVVVLVFSKCQTNCLAIKVIN